MSRRQAALTVAILMLVSTMPSVTADPPTPQSLTIELYVDGYATIEYTLKTQPEIPEANVTVYGQMLQDLIIVDAANLPLDYTQKNGVIKVNTLGTDTVKITYSTQDLSSKDGRFWVLNITTPIKTTLLLPPEATVVEFTPIPDLMESQGDQVLLIMPQGPTTITYVTSVIGTREYAQAVLSNTEEIINELKTLGINMKTAEDLYQVALAAFNQGDYIKAETDGKQAKEQALQIQQDHAQATNTIQQAENAIGQAETESRTTLLEEAGQLLTQSKTSFSTGNYTQATYIANQSIDKARTSQAPFPTTTIAGALVILLLAGVLFIKVRPKPQKHTRPKERKPIDIDRYMRNDELRQDEKDAVKIIAENNGEILEAELYTRLSLPRTTTWRLVKRLEKMGIVEITKIRRSNIIRLKK